ncbi:MAG: GNAT family N-acetyltransferase, partial [Candidatus Bathyarchaeota archaeon]|nr:GNAT family N-acetyltransferase [Candidatus Bathyarchaeota archaeon]
ISAEDRANDVLIGYLRLRFPSEKAHRPEIFDKKASLIRELHIYGPLVPVGHRFEWGYQHHGYGAQLLRKAEKISEEHGFRKIVVTSALGTKPYYIRLGYRHEGPYMTKRLN